jgi:hypothetical protein
MSWEFNLMKRFLVGITCAVCALAGGAQANADADAPDLTKIERQIRKEPAYTGKQPLYGLYVFGPKAATRVWAVLDKSDETNAIYDVLYFDRNANGDLTEPDERFTGPGRFKVGTFTDPVTGDVHKNLTISRNTEGSVFISVSWKGEELIRGGYAEEPGPYCVFGESPATAPILWPGAEGPLGFQRWQFNKEYGIGAENDARVFLGHAGVGRNTFCAVTQSFLPDSTPVLATLIYRDGEGKERRSQNELRERC